MNYFGLFFSFMIPGVVIGTMAASAVKEAAAKKGRRQAMMRRRAMHTVPKNKAGLLHCLTICPMCKLASGLLVGNDKVKYNILVHLKYN